MKTKDKTEKTFDTVKVFRAIKEKIAKETENMTCEQFKAYLKKHQMEQATKSQIDLELKLLGHCFVSSFFAGRSKNQAWYYTKELAEKCGTNKSYISRIENNESDIRLSTLLKIVQQDI